MKVILQDDVIGLGEEGDVREVKSGYARNFLFRRKIAVPFSSHAMTLVEHRRDNIEKRKEEKRAGAAGMRERIEAEEINFKMNAGGSGKLFGSITNAAIASELEKRGLEIDRKRIEVPDHSLKTVGEHTVRIRLYENEAAQLKVTIEPETN